MTSDMLTELLKSLGLLSAFLLVGAALRATVKPLQKTFIPASVIGGALLLVLGPQALDLLPVPSEWFTLYSMLPGILIVPVVTATPLGLALGKGSPTGSSRFMRSVVPLTCIGLAVSMLQFAVGYGTHTMFAGSYELYDVFGIELAIGFVGGHGTAGTLGNLLSEMNLPYWAVSQGVATTTATFGLVGGILIGIVLINWAARHGHTALLTRPADIPHSVQVGFEQDIAKQPSSGRETTLPSSIDVLGFHAAVIFVGCGLAYLILKLVKKYSIPILSSISVWAYGMLVMFVLWWLICKLKLDYLVDAKVKSHITGSFTEFAVISAVASLPIKAVAAYLVPILTMVVAGYVVTTGVLLFLCRRLLRDYWFEQMIGTLGMATGVFITGVLLLRICDPDLETPALASYSLSYSVISIVYFAMLNFFLVLPLTAGALATALTAGGIAALFALAAGIASRIAFGRHAGG